MENRRRAVSFASDSRIKFIGDFTMLATFLGTVLALVSQAPEPPRLDASSEEALETSIRRMIESLPPGDGWHAHPLSLALDSLGNTEGMAERNRASTARGERPEAVPVLKHLHGMTYQQIIAAWHAREKMISERTRAKMEREGIKYALPVANPAFDVRYPGAPTKYPVDPNKPAPPAVQIRSPR